jgi:hypothetical protein
MQHIMRIFFTILFAVLPLTAASKDGTITEVKFICTRHVNNTYFENEHAQFVEWLKYDKFWKELHCLLPLNYSTMLYQLH